MRRMYTEKQVRELADEEVASKVVESLAGKDISIEGLTSKGIANTGGLANIGNVAISGELSVSGDTKVFENIVDKDGHKRFVEGTLEVPEIDDVTVEYKKWSLSGTHLMCVLVLSALNGATIPQGPILTLQNLPDWILNKVVPVYGTNRVSRFTITFYADNETTQTVNVRILRDTNIRVNLVQSLTMTANRTCRINFDLLIDNE